MDQNRSALRLFSMFLHAMQYFAIFAFLADSRNFNDNKGLFSLGRWLALFFVLYIEKFYVKINRSMEELLASAVPSQRYVPLYDETDYIEANYSTLTKMLPILENIPHHIYQSCPKPIQTAADYINKEISMSTNEYIIRALRNGNVTNNHLKLGTLTEEEAGLLIDALRNKNGPADLKIDYAVDYSFLNSDIHLLIEKNNVHHAALACVTIQQGKRDEKSIFSTLPQEMLQKIYEHIYPINANQKNLRPFLKKVSNSHCFFKSPLNLHEDQDTKNIRKDCKPI